MARDIARDERVMSAHLAASIAVALDHLPGGLDVMTWGQGSHHERVTSVSWSGGTVKIVLSGGQTFIAAISDASGMFGADVLERARQSAAAAGIAVEEQLTDQDKADRIGERLFPGVSFA